MITKGKNSSEISMMKKNDIFRKNYCSRSKIYDDFNFEKPF